MKTFLKYGFILSMFILPGCASQRESPSTQESQKLDKLIAEKSFEIRANWAMPLVSNSLNSIANVGLLPLGSTANQIDITGTSSHLRILGDSVVANLPYYGERQMGAAYNSQNVGIQFKGNPERFQITKQKNGKGYELSFLINKETETYDVNVNLYPNLQGRISINSSHRNVIAYRGQVYAFSAK